LVDGCNFLGRARGWSLGEASDRARLIRRLQDYRRAHPAQEVRLWFDGERGSRERIAGVEVLYVGPRSADESILDFVRGLERAARSQARLITDDRDLARRARQSGARTSGVSWLAERLVEPGDGSSEPQLGPGELQEWLEYFGQE